MNTPEPGTLFGNLRFIGIESEANRTKRWQQRWRLACHCGKEVVWKSSLVTSGKAVTCGCGIRKIVGEDASMSIVLRKLLSTYRKSCRVRGVEWAINDDFAISLFYSACHYCGESPSRLLKNTAGKTAPRPVNGIDRVSSKDGYTESNTVACCPKCNYAKGKMEYVEYIELVSKTYEHLKLLNMSTPKFNPTKDGLKPVVSTQKF